jgi:hypothetical protein
MDRSVAARAPARALPQERRVIYTSDINLPSALVLLLGVALEAEIGIALHEQLSVY